jgi:hypothetical protein
MEVKRAEERAGGGTKRLTVVDAAHRIPMAGCGGKGILEIPGGWEEK